MLVTESSGGRKRKQSSFGAERERKYGKVSLITVNGEGRERAAAHCGEAFSAFKLNTSAY